MRHADQNKEVIRTYMRSPILEDNAANEVRDVYNVPLFSAILPTMSELLFSFQKDAKRRV
jgi:hypothetical protein